MFFDFDDIEKAFDEVNLLMVFDMLKRAAITVRKLYKNERAIIKTGDIQKKSRIKKGVRQGCT